MSDAPATATASSTSHDEPVADSTVPGQAQLGGVVDRFDARADQLLERWRGHSVVDRVFTTASHVGDFSLVWHVIGATRGLVRGRPDQIVVLAVSLGVESLVVNQGVKRLFRRERPTSSGDERLRVRTPSTSAFPSGHASSAAFAATLLSRWDARTGGRPSPWPLVWWGVAGIVGTSRAYVRIHHASDVVGGALVGRALGLVVWRLAAGRLRR